MSASIADARNNPCSTHPLRVWQFAAGAWQEHAREEVGLCAARFTAPGTLTTVALVGGSGTAELVVGGRVLTSRGPGRANEVARFGPHPAPIQRPGDFHGAPWRTG